MRRLTLPFALAGVLTAALERPGLGGPLPIRAQRRWLDLAAAGLPVPAHTVVRKVELGGRAALRVTVGATERSRAIVHLHGGAYTVGSPAAYTSMAAYLAESAGAAVYLPDYRLAPEHPFPAALDDAIAACRDIAAQHRAYSISGDSAGGGLAVATTRRLIDAGSEAPRAMALASPWVDPAARSAHRKRDLIVREKWGLACAAQYLGSGDARDPGFAPLHGSLAGLPAALIHVCTKEVLYDQVTTFARALTSAGVEVSVTEQRLWHAGIAQAGLVADAHQAVTEFGEFLDRAMRQTPAVDPSEGGQSRPR
ncbi:alpha/beta hydrolase [soil metagenome]